MAAACCTQTVLLLLLRLLMSSEMRDGDGRTDGGGKSSGEKGKSRKGCSHVTGRLTSPSNLPPTLRSFVSDTGHAVRRTCSKRSVCARVCWLHAARPCAAAGHSPSPSNRPTDRGSSQPVSPAIHCVCVHTGRQSHSHEHTG